MLKTTNEEGELSKEQSDKIVEIALQGYKLDMKDSISACGLVYKKGEDIWFFGLEGEIMHNP